MSIIDRPCPICTLPLEGDGGCLRHDPEEVVAKLLEQRDRALAALKLIWPRGKDCEHQHAREAFRALGDM